MISILIVMTGLMAGIYFTFSAFVMKSLDRLPSSQAISAMNSINLVIVRTSFLPLFFISTLGHLVLMVWSVMYPQSGHPLYFWAGLIYVLGMFGVTLFGNVPLNNHLLLSDSQPHSSQTDDKTGAHKQEAERKSELSLIWRTYLVSWTRLNHIRTISCTVSMALLTYSLGH